MVKGGSGCNRVRGLLPLADPGNAAVGDLWQQRLLSDAMMWGAAGQGPVARSHPLPHQGPAQGSGSLAQTEGQRWELEALWAELEEERLRIQELRRCFTAKSQELKAPLEREQQLLADGLQS